MCLNKIFVYASSNYEVQKTGDEPALSEAGSSTASTAASSTDGYDLGEPPEPCSRQVVGEMFLANKLSAKDVNKINKAHFYEGNHAALEWARIGNWGKSGKNLARDLMRNLLRGMTMPPLFYWKIPVWCLESDEQVTVDFPFLLPHEVIHRLVLKNGC